MGRTVVSGEVTERVVLHIGPPKTGTSAIQGACHSARQLLLAQGVRYAGRTQQVGRAAYAAVGRIHPSIGEVPSMRYWKDLISEVRTAQQRKVFVSSEFFAGADDNQAQQIVRELGGDQVHVVITLRPISRILASRWQQNVQEGARYSYDEWLHWIFERPADKKGLAFWSRHRHDELVHRWSSAVGSNRVSIIIADDRDRMHTFRSFETLLGLDLGSLVPQKDAANRSLTFEEAELLRRVNELLNEVKIPRHLQYKLVTRGIAMYIKEHEPSQRERAIVTPDWAIQQADNIGRETVASIRSLGVRVIGDIDSLGGTTSVASDAIRIPPIEAPSPTDGVSNVDVNVDTAARSVIGVLVALGYIRGAVGKWSNIDTRVEPPQLQRVHTVDLARVIAQRAIWFVSSMIRRVLTRNQRTN